MLRPTYLYITFLFATTLLGIFFMYGLDLGATRKKEVSAEQSTVQEESKAYVLPVSEPSLGPMLNTKIPRPVLNARAALVYDIKSGRFLYEENSNEKLPIASLTKILSAIVALENMDQTEIVRITREAVKVDEEKQDLYLDERISVSDLLKLMLVESSNDAAYALALHANSQGIDFVDKMNQKAFSLGMFDSYFLDPAGLNDEAFSTASDLSKLISHSLRYGLIWDILKEEELIVSSEDEEITHHVKTTNRLFDIIPNIEGGKTGFTDGALGCMILSASVDGKNNIISIVLGSNDRFGDTVKIFNWTKSAYKWR